MATPFKEVALRAKVNRIPKSRVWFDRAEWYWYGWRTLLPVHFSHDEYARRTFVVGWTITGHIVMALGYCGDMECLEDAVKWHEITGE